MLGYSTVFHEASLKQLPFYAVFSGTTAIVQGQLLCYDYDRGTATAEDGSRCNYVKIASQTNNRWPAGYATRNYAAPDANGKRDVQLFAPGSVCQVSILKSVTAAAAGVPGTLVTALANTIGSGLSVGGKLPGAGSAEALQTVTIGNSASSSVDGSATFTGTTLTKTGVGAAAASSIGDEVYFIAGSTTASGAALITASKQTVLTQPLSSTITVGTTIGTAVSVVYYIRTGNQTAMCLTHGNIGWRYSGLIEFVAPATTALNGAAMVEGTTRIMGGVTIAADTVPPLAVGTATGQRKLFVEAGAITTSTYKVTPTSTTAIQINGTSTLASVAIAADADEYLLEWMGSKWRGLQKIGCTEA